MNTSDFININYISEDESTPVNIITENDKELLNIDKPDDIEDKSKGASFFLKVFPDMKLSKIKEILKDCGVVGYQNNKGEILAAYCYRLFPNKKNRKGNWVEVPLVGVDENERGMGWGGKLLKDIDDWLDYNNHKIFLHAYPNAVSFYKKYNYFERNENSIPKELRAPQGLIFMMKEK